MDYESSLDRAMDSVPEIDSSGERLSVPDANAQKDGAFTRLTNLESIADTLSRDPDHLHRFVQRELGTNGKLEQGVGRYNGNFSGSDLDAAVEEYIQTYVLCGDAVEENETYTLKITSTGRKGDGVAEKGEYTIFVPGAQEGDVVEAYIENISGSLAFARLESKQN